jgi:hypothetical protein
VEYTGNVTTQTADIQTAKSLFNSVVSTPSARFMTLDLKDFYLCSDLPDYEDVRIPTHMMPPAIVKLHQLESKISNGYVYAEMRKGMYGLPQAGKLANDWLRKFLAPFGHVPCPVTPGLWKQANATTATMKAITKLLDYCATHPDAVVRYYSSDMIIWIESNASYLSKIKAQSRAARYHYLSNKPPNPNQPPAPTDPSTPMNGAIVMPCTVMREVLSSASEAESAALFYNGKEGAPLRITLKELSHKQPPTPMVTDNSTASGIANKSVKQKRSKAMDIRFYWIRDRVQQN